ncbi:ABC transporter permease [bacterium]|nr:ABC transporter permease [bacterium]MDD5917775.1 ABC transporter permease [bacterium]
MLKYSLKRLVRSLLTLVILITIIFALLRLMPEEGYFNNYEKMSPAAIDFGLREMGLKDPLYVQVGRFFKNLLQGDLGISRRYRVNYPITDLIAPKMKVSMKVGLVSMIVSLPLGMALGALMARSKGGLADKLGNAYIVFIQAVPNAVYFIFIQLYGSSWFNLSVLYKPEDWTSLILPVISLALPSISSYAMWLRRYMVDETNKDYIKLARAKGVPNTTIWFRHVFRNSVVPMVNLIPGSILLTISGSIYVESLYSIPGMGGLLVDVIKRQDNNMVLALVVIFASLSILGLLLGDILMGIVDPRISFSKKEGAR